MGERVARIARGRRGRTKDRIPIPDSFKDRRRVGEDFASLTRSPTLSSSLSSHLASPAAAFKGHFTLSVWKASAGERERERAGEG